MDVNNNYRVILFLLGKLFSMYFDINAVPLSFSNANEVLQNRKVDYLI